MKKSEEREKTARDAHPEYVKKPQVSPADNSKTTGENKNVKN